MLFWVIFGWALYRSDYSEPEKNYLYILAILMTLPPLIWGLTELLILNSTSALQLHSVGHVNHSAIYLCMITGAMASFILVQLQTAQKKYVFIAIFFLIVLSASVIISQSRGAFGILFLLIYTLILLVKLSIKIKTIMLSLLTIFLITIFL